MIKPTTALFCLLLTACSTSYPILEPEAKVFKKQGNDVMFIFNEHQGKRTGYQWFRVDNPEDYKIDSVYYLSPKMQNRALK
ncbi:hypothetical protein [Cyclobacterium plantarum]|uniref:Lipoprotein n=1 Tax=Cyclobacterium plantarum TaxID=2716263 RepID=A0ABX0H2Y3_9BACT|nr:hypothetical protein [Cyclobacterium plantarum]NHE56160.1 hypothetical protein [Cyclobacterium plantarum]